MSKIFLLGIFSLVMVVVLLVYLDSKGQIDTELIKQTFKNLQAQTTKFADGSEITYLVPEQPESDKITPSQELIDKANAENATEADKAINQIITPQQDVPQYSKKDPIGVVISGYILLKDEVTEENIKPFVYKLLIHISCKDVIENEVEGFIYCSTDDIFGRVETSEGGKDKDGNELGGYFEYFWHPKFADQSGFYEVNILVTKDQAQLDGTYKEYEKSYKIQVL